MRRQIIATAVAAAALVAGQGTSWAASSYAGSPTSADRYYAVQTVPDCVEWTTRVAVDEIKHKAVVSQASIDSEAEKLGLYIPGEGSTGPAWPSLLAHYGVKATFGSMSRTRLEADLAKHDVVIVTVNANTLWAPLGYWDGTTNTATAGHAVIVEAVNKKTNAVTLADGGIPVGENEVVPWSTFSRAWAAGSYSSVVVS